MERGVCGRNGSERALHWDERGGVRLATTRQLIVQQNFMLQFQVTSMVVRTRVQWWLGAVCVRV